MTGKGRTRSCASLGIVLLLTALALTACSSSGGSEGSDGPKGSGGAPTEAEVKATIESVFTPIYGVNSGGAKYEDISFDFGKISIGSPTDHQADYGADARTVWPVKAPVTITVSFANNPNDAVTHRGEADDDRYFFYRDSFGDWTFKTGRE